MQGEISVWWFRSKLWCFAISSLVFCRPYFFQVARNMRPKIFNLNLWCLAGINWKWLRFIKIKTNYGLRLCYLVVKIDQSKFCACYENYELLWELWKSTPCISLKIERFWLKIAHFCSKPLILSVKIAKMPKNHIVGLTLVTLCDPSRAALVTNVGPMEPIKQCYKIKL